MKNKIISNIAKNLMKFQPLKITIIDDGHDYFSQDMLRIAKASGIRNITRLYKINSKILEDLLKDPQDIIILDIKGIVEDNSAKDGFDIAKILSEQTSSYVVITSAHQYKLRNRITICDYIIDDRLLTPVDFVSEMNFIINDMFERKKKFYSKIVFKIGFKILKKSLIAA